MRAILTIYPGSGNVEQMVQDFSSKALSDNYNSWQGGAVKKELAEEWRRSIAIFFH